MVHPVNCDFLVSVSNLMLLGFRQEAGVYFLHNSDVEACVCMWNKYLKSNFFFSGNIIGSVLDIIFFQDALFKSTTYLSFWSPSSCPKVLLLLFQ